MVFFFRNPYYLQLTSLPVFSISTYSWTTFISFFWLKILLLIFYLRNSLLYLFILTSLLFYLYFKNNSICYLLWFLWCKFWVFKMVLCVFSCFIPFSLLVTYFEIESNISIYSVHDFGVFSLFVVLIFYLFSFLIILGFNFVFCCLFLHGINFIRVLEWVMVHGSYSNFIELHLFPPPPPKKK